MRGVRARFSSKPKQGGKLQCCCREYLPQKSLHHTTQLCFAEGSVMQAPAAVVSLQMGKEEGWTIKHQFALQPEGRWRETSENICLPGRQLCQQPGMKVAVRILQGSGLQGETQSSSFSLLRSTLQIRYKNQPSPSPEPHAQEKKNKTNTKTSVVLAHHSPVLFASLANIPFRVTNSPRLGFL